MFILYFLFLSRGAGDDYIGGGFEGRGDELYNGATCRREKTDRRIAAAWRRRWRRRLANPFISLLLNDYVRAV